MATSSTNYSSWRGNVGTYRLKINISRTAVSESLNRSTIRTRVWVQSDSSSSFAITTSRSLTVDGDSRLSGSTGITCNANSEVLIADDTKHVTHKSDGTRSVKASATLNNTYAGSHSVSTTINLNRINQLPDAPTGAPTVSRSGNVLTITSYSADGNGNSITGYQIRRRVGSGSWVYSTGKQLVFTAVPGSTYQFESRASTSRGWGPYSSTRTYTVPLDTSGVGSVELELTVGTVKAIWTKPPVGTVARYEAQLSTNGVYGPIVDAGLNLENTWGGLSVGTYLVQVRPIFTTSTVGPWEQSDAEYLGTSPGVIPSLTLDDEGTATWTAPPDGGSPILGYRTQWWDGFSWSSPQELAQTSLTYQDNPLPGIGYRIRVAAYNRMGQGPFATSTYQVIFGCPCVV